MAPAIQVIWWIGLVGALLATVVVLKQVAVTLRTLRHILTLAERTRQAAEGLAEHTGAAAGLEGLEPPLARLHGASAEVAAVADSLGRRLDALAFGPGRGG